MYLNAIMLQSKNKSLQDFKTSHIHIRITVVNTYFFICSSRILLFNSIPQLMTMVKYTSCSIKTSTDSCNIFTPLLIRRRKMAMHTTSITAIIVLLCCDILYTSIRVSLKIYFSENYFNASFMSFTYFPTYSGASVPCSAILD